MREIVKSILLEADCGVLRLSRTVRRAASRAPAVLVLPPALIPGSVGDGAMLTAVTDYATEVGFERADVLSCTEDAAWGDVAPFHAVVTGFEGAPCRDFASTKRFARVLSSYTHFLCIGADMLDGGYGEYRAVQMIRAVEIAARTGLAAGFTPFSWNANPAPGALAAMRRLPRRVTLYVRDPVSVERLRRAVSHRVVEVADVAFFVKPTADRPLVQAAGEWAARVRGEGRAVLGVNLNRLPIAELGSEPLRFLELLSAALVNVDRSAPLAVMVVSHDARDADNELSDCGLARRLEAILDGRVPVHRVPKVPPASEVKALAGVMDAVLATRMHFAIACLGMGTPILSIPFQGKFEGLLGNFGISNLVLGRDDVNVQVRVTEKIEHLLRNAALTRAQIEKHLPRVQEQCRAGLAGVLPMADRE